MGLYKNIAHDKFPEQSERVGQPVDVCFHYNTDDMMSGVIERDDMEQPFRTIIRLANNNLILASECQWKDELCIVRG